MGQEASSQVPSEPTFQNNMRAGESLPAQQETSEPRHNRRAGELEHQASSQVPSEPSQGSDGSCRGAMDQQQIPAALQPEDQLAPSTPPRVMLQQQLQKMQVQLQQQCIAQLSALQTVQYQHFRMMKQEFDHQEARLQQLHQEALEQMQSPLQHLEQYVLHLQQQLQTQLQQQLDLLRLSYQQMRQEVQQHVHYMQQQLLQETRQQLQGLNEQQVQQVQVHHHAV